MARTPEDINRRVKELTRKTEAQLELGRLTRAGNLVIQLAESLHTAEILLDTMDAVTAPDDMCILLVPRGDETTLRLQRAAQGTETRRGEPRYLKVEPLEEQVDSILGAKKDSRDYVAFVGRSIEWDRAESKFFVYDEERATRVEHHDHFSLVSMLDLEDAQTRFPISLGYPEAKLPVVHTPF